MKQKRKQVARTVFAALLCFLLLPMGAVALAEETGGLSKSKTSSEYELSANNDTTTMTLSLPSDEYLDTFDIVFVVDASNESAAIEAKASELMDSLLDEDLNVNIGVVKFKGQAQDTINTVSGEAYSGLTALSDETSSYIKEAIDFNPDTDPRSTCGNGTNIHSALLLAQKWLDASDTPNDHKYVLMFTDGRAYIYDDGNGTPTSIYAQYHRSGVTSNRLINGGKPTINSQAQADKYHATIPGNIIKDEELAAEFTNAIVRFGTNGEHSARDFQQLYDSDNPELTGPSPYETTCYYVGSGTDKKSTLGENVTKAATAEWSTYFKNGASLFKDFYLSDATDPYLQLSPLKTEYDEATKTYTYLGELNPDYWMFHVSSAEKALYLAGHTWTDLGENYHTIAIANDRGFTAGLETCKDFLAWLPENSEMAAEVKDTSGVAALFDELENQLIYAVGKAVVTDAIPEYLNLVEDAYDGIPFQVTVDGEALAATPTAGGAWGFGTPKDDVYPYEVKWDESARTFTFYINVPVENAKPVKLNYKLQWNGEGEEDVDVVTNKSTTIEYWPSNDPEGESTTEPYVSPVVIYRSTVDYTATKEWDDKDDADGIRPKSVEVQLYANGEATGDPVTLDADGKWTHTWTGLVKNDDGEAIDYSVEEVNVPDKYTAKVEEAESGYEATITNSHTPEKPSPTPGPDPDDGDDDNSAKKSPSNNSSHHATPSKTSSKTIPRTGDDSPIMPTIAIILASGILVFVAWKRSLPVGKHCRR